MKKYKYIFGPVNSRRLGISLGIDLLPFKTCSLNCIYCECGSTTNLTTERKEYVPTSEVIAEIDLYLQNNNPPDFITFSGSGEPTLHTGIGQIIAHIKNKFSKQKIAVLTNSTLLHIAEVRNAIKPSDLIMPSFDASSESSFNKILRPHPSINSKIIFEGIISLRKEYSGILILEFFVIPGINDSNEELALIKDAILEISPDSVQINSLSRPGAVNWIQTPSIEELNNIAKKFTGIPIQIIKESNLPFSDEDFIALENNITEILKKKNRTLHEIVSITGGKALDINKALSNLVDKNIVKIIEGEIRFFHLNI